jgi:type II secretion system (T2SS) protein E
MNKQVDVYRDWLGIAEPKRPLNHYQLLRLNNFEDDAAKVRAHFQKMNAHIRKYLAGDQADRAHALLDEMTKAMLCLTDSRRKSDYDASIGRAGGGGARSRSLEEILLLRKVLDKESLEKCRKLAAAIGIDLRDAVMQQKVAKPEVIMQAYAESLGLPFIDLSIMQIDGALIPKLPAVLARQHSCVPLLVDDEKVIVASPNPLRTEVEDEVRLRFGLPVRTVLCTPTDIHEVINRHYPREAAAAQMGVTSSAEQQKDTGPKMDPVERKKRQRQITMVAGMMTFMIISIAGSMSTSMQAMGAPKIYAIAACMAAMSSGIAWFATK